MGYTFTIGNAVPEFSKDDDHLSARWVVEDKVLPEAPEFPNDDMTGKSNSRSPGYGAWADFCRETGIYDLFYDERGRLHDGHPGCGLLKESGYHRIKEAREAWQKHATKPPGFAGMARFNHDKQAWESPDEGMYDHQLARLMWLEFWVRWALDNCETPAIQNT